MKKVLSLVLAVVLCLGMTTVAFAKQYDKGTYKLVISDLSDPTEAYLDDDGDIGDLYTTGSIEPGDTLYFPVYAYEYTTKGESGIADSGSVKLAALNDFRISYSIDDGKNMIESVKFVVNKADKGPKGLYIAVKIRDNFILDDQDVDMKIRVNAKDDSYIIDQSGNAIDPNKPSEEFNLKFNASYGTEEDLGNGYYTVGANVITFADDADDVVLCFNDDKSDVEVTGNMKGQKKVFVRMSTSNTALEDKYPDATLRLFDGDKDTFKREVTVKMPYETAVDNPYLYEVTAKGELVKLIGGSKASKEAGTAKVEYDDTKASFIFKTNTLGNYLMSDVELKSTSSSTEEKPSTGTDGNETNPGTGASDFVGLAVALAVVSVAGIAVAKRK